MQIAPEAWPQLFPRRLGPFLLELRSAPGVDSRLPVPRPPKLYREKTPIGLAALVRVAFPRWGRFLFAASRTERKGTIPKILKGDHEPWGGMERAGTMSRVLAEIG
jgi:hypothetical protein